MEWIAKAQEHKEINHKFLIELEFGPKLPGWQSKSLL